MRRRNPIPQVDQEIHLITFTGHQELGVDIGVFRGPTASKVTDSDI